MNARFGVAALSILFLAGAALARPPEGGPGGPEKWEKKREARMQEMHKKLGLTPEQEKRLEEHRKTHQEAGKALREEKREKMEALRLELEKPDMDEARVRAIHAEIKDIQNKLADHRLQGVLEVRHILTPEQFKKFHDMAGPRWKDKDGKGPGRERQGRRGDGPPPEE